MRLVAELVEEGSSGGDYRINGVNLPLAEWPVGSYWTVDGKPSADINNSIVFEDSRQCAGFARYVYSRIWGSSTYGTRFGVSSNDNRTLVGNSSDFSGFIAGSRINCDRQDGGGNHSMVILEKTSSGVTVYEANHDGRCGVGMRTISFEDFADEYINIKYTSYVPTA